jgi:cyanophycinase
MKKIIFLLMLAGQTFAQSGLQHGSLVIVGGGAIDDEIWSSFIQLAGGTKAHIIYVPTAQEDSSLQKSQERTLKRLKALGVAEVTVLHTRDPRVANTADFVAPVKRATGVWFEGGRQWRIADGFLNTLAHREFRALLDRGGVIGGTSAGATIIGSFLVRGDTKGNTVMIGDHTEGLGFLPNVTIDQHLLKRNRQFDLVEVIRSKPDLLGIGIDESTAIIVQKDTFKVVGRSYVAIYDHRRISGEEQASGPFYYLQSGQKFDLSQRRLIAPPATGTLTGANNR